MITKPTSTPASPADPPSAGPPCGGNRPNAGRELRDIALVQFVSMGFAATSLQHIADAAGYLKSSVLYHFASKEALLDKVLTPAIDRLDEILERFAAHEGGVPPAGGEHSRLVWLRRRAENAGW